MTVPHLKRTNPIAGDLDKDFALSGSVADEGTGISTPPALVIEYKDPLEGFRGWFVRHTMRHSLCAGGLRLQGGLTRSHLEAMARNMTRKMRIAGLKVDGAKCGIDYQPDRPGKAAAVCRFLAALRPYIENVYSMGPDFNVDMDLLEKAAGEVGIPSVKMAIAKAQGWDLEYFLRRSRALSLPMDDGWTLNRLRAGFGVAAAALAVLDRAGRDRGQATAVIQGFGTLAKAIAHTLLQKGVRIVGIGDACKCYLAEKNGQAVDEALLCSRETLLPEVPPPHLRVRVEKSEALLATACDLLIPAAVEDAVHEENFMRCQAHAIVPGANLAVSERTAACLEKQGITVVPDYVAGCGGSLSMEGLYGPVDHPEPVEVLAHIERKMTSMVQQILDLSERQHISSATAAARLCQTVAPGSDSGGPPYRL